MKLTLGIASHDSAEELQDLREWISSDADIRTRIESSYVSPSPRAEDMGAEQVLELVLSSSIDLASLLVAIAAWRDSRRAQPTVTISRDGKPSVEIASSDEATIREVTVKLEGEADAKDSES